MELFNRPLRTTQKVIVMSKYIEADKLKVELKKLSESDNPIEYSSMEKSAYNCALYDVEYLITSLQQEQPEPFSCSYENGSEPKPEGIEAVVHHCANVHYLVTNTEQLNAQLKQFDNDAKVLVYIEARKED